MFLLVQLALFVGGIVVMCQPVLRFGRTEVRRPASFFVGLILVMSLPFGVALGFALGAGTAIQSIRSGKEMTPKAIAKQYAWLDPAITGSAVVLAGLTCVMGARPPRAAYDADDELSVVGVRRYDD